MPGKDYKKELRALYTGKAGRVDAIDVPPLTYLALSGVGHPAQAFGPAMHALYALAYPLKYLVRARDAKLDYVVMPPEALYTGKPSVYEGPPEAWPWTLLVMQPVAPTAAELREAKESARGRGAPALVEDVKLERIHEGRCLQTLHLGDYGAMVEERSLLQSYAEERKQKLGGPHHEIYLSDPKRVAPGRAKTLLRLPIVPTPVRRVAPLAHR